MMENVRLQGKGWLKLLLSALVALGLCLGGLVALAPDRALAAESNQKVLDQRNGVFKFNWGFDGEEYARGSAFLINEDTIVTAYHCVMPSSTELAYYKDKLGINVEDFQEHSTYSITVSGDFQVPATLERVSERQDMAILKLDQKVNNATTLPLRDSSTVEASEVVYSLGFPVDADQYAVVTFTSDDVTVANGTVTKPEGQMKYLTNTLQECEGSFIMTNCAIQSGSSGGPMVDEDGYVVGICVASDQSYYYAAASDVLADALDSMGYEYKKADGSTSKGGSGESSSAGANGSTSGNDSNDEGESGEGAYALNFDELDEAISAGNAVSREDVTEESYAAITDALDEGAAAKGLTLDDPADKSEYEKKQKQINDAASAIDKAVQGAKPAESGLPLAVIVAIVVAVVAIIAVVVFVVVRSRKKKADQQVPPAIAPTPTAPVSTPAPAAAPQALGSGGSQSWQRPGGAAAAPAVSETTILDNEESDTVILFQAASGGSLTRMSTNEQIPINSAEFTIGRERSKVNYCLEGNSSISRVHVRMVVRDGNVYLIDNRAANGTFVNGVKCRPGEEVQLKPGDIVTLADEKFKYNS